MSRSAYYIVSDTTEDRFDVADSLDEALRIARGLVKEGQAEGPVLIEHEGRVVHQLVLTADGQIEEEPIR